MISLNSDMPAEQVRPGVTLRKPKHDPAVLQVTEATYEAGAQMSAKHTHDISEIYYIVKGKLRLSLGDEEAVLEDGCFFYVPARTPHEIKEVIERTTVVNVTTPEKAHDQAHAHPHTHSHDQAPDRSH